MTFEAELEQRLTAEIESYKESLTLGAMDPQQYQRTCGVIYAFRAVIELFPEIHKKMSER